MLGFDAIGRLALGQVPPSPNGNGHLTGVAAIGVVGTLGKEVDKGLTGVAGMGTVGGMAANPAALLIGVKGAGKVGSLTSSVSANVIGASGTGVAGTGVVGLIGTVPPGVAGIGVVGSLRGSIQGFLQGVAGIGVVGQITASPGGNFTGVSGAGFVGQITVVISGGGGNGGDGDRPRRKRRTGLEPIAKVPPAKLPAPKPIALPPDWLRGPASPPLAPGLPAEETDPAFATAMPRIAQAIAEAHRTSDQNYDEQDMADIADVLALLD